MLLLPELRGAQSSLRLCLAAGKQKCGEASAIAHLPAPIPCAAWRRGLASGKTEYKSITVAEDATAEEFMVSWRAGRG